jgi:competence protein ComEC
VPADRASSPRPGRVNPGDASTEPGRANPGDAFTGPGRANRGDPAAPGNAAAPGSSRRLRDPDPDGVAMAGAVAAGVLAGTFAGGAHPRLLVAVAAAAVVLAGVVLRGAGGHRGAGGAGAGGAVHGVLALALLAVAGAGVAGARAAAVRGGVLVGLLSRGGTLTLEATVAEEPRRVRYGGRWVVLSVRRVEVGGDAWRTRERAGVILPESAGEIAVGDRLRISAGIERSDRTDPLGGEPATVLRRPRILSRSPSRSRLLRASESIRGAARTRALDSLPPERAGLLLGIVLGDTSLEPASVDRAFTTAGLTHLTAVSGQNLAVVLAAGLGIAVAFRAGRPTLAMMGILLIGLFALLTRWEPSVLRAGAMAVLALLGVATGRGPGGRRALCLAVALLLLSNPSLLWSLGFQLSVAATAGVLWLGPTATRALPSRLPRLIRSATGISLGAQAGATPALALAFGQVSVAGLAANLVAVPIRTAAEPYRSLKTP